METRENFDLSYKRQKLLAIISRASLLQGREFRLTSGGSSNFFIDLKKTMLDPEGASLLARGSVLSNCSSFDLQDFATWCRGTDQIAGPRNLRGLWPVSCHQPRSVQDVLFKIRRPDRRL